MLAESLCNQLHVLKQLFVRDCIIVSWYYSSGLHLQLHAYL